MLGYEWAFSYASYGLPVSPLRAEQILLQSPDNANMRYRLSITLTVGALPSVCARRLTLRGGFLSTASKFSVRLSMSYGPQGRQHNRVALWVTFFVVSTPPHLDDSVRNHPPWEKERKLLVMSEPHRSLFQVIRRLFLAQGQHITTATRQRSTPEGAAT
jgi:hypothetical protein